MVENKLRKINLSRNCYKSLVCATLTKLHFWSLQVNAVFERNDGNHDGKLTLTEFQEFMHNHEKKKQPDS